MDFADWKKLHHHVTWTCLQARPDARPDLTTFKQKQETFKGYARMGIDEVAKHPTLCNYFNQRCLLCNRYTTGGRCIQNHHLAEHPEAYSLHLVPYQERYTCAISCENTALKGLFYLVISSPI